MSRCSGLHSYDKIDLLPTDLAICDKTDFSLDLQDKLDTDANVKAQGIRKLGH